MARASKYTKESLIEMTKALGIKTRSDLQKANASAYNAARKGGWLDELFPAAATKKAPAPKAEAPKEAAKVAAKPTRRRQAPTKSKPATATVTISNISSMEDLDAILEAADKIKNAEFTFRVNGAAA